MARLQPLIGWVLALGATLCVANAESVPWNQFRGPNGSGVGVGCHPPVTIAPGSEAWRTPVPPGNSSPVLWAGRVFLTAVEGGRLVTLAVDTHSGAVSWKRLAPQARLETVHAANSVAASTPCVDDQGVYVYFGSFGLIGYDHQGGVRWEKAIPTPRSLYGMATSPILHGRLVILVLDDEANLEDSQLSRSKVMALDQTTGEVVWETPRPLHRSAWATPMIWRHAGEADLIVLGNGRLVAYEPRTGQEKWYVNGFSREPIAVPIADDAHLYASVSMRGGGGEARLDPEPFWVAALQFDRNGDGRVAREEVSEHFTVPLRPELPAGHPGFGLPLPSDPVKRRERQFALFDWRDKDKDGFWTKGEFLAEMTLGQDRPNLAAIRPGGTGDVTDSHVSWNLRTGIPEIPSPVLYEGRLYLVRDGGLLTCVRSDTGEVVYRERLGAAGQYAASPVIANDHLYAISAQGVATVVRCGDTFNVVQQTDLGASVMATPAISVDTLFVRTAEALIAFR